MTYELPDFDERLLEIGRADLRKSEELGKLEAKRAKLYKESGLAELDKQIKALKRLPDEMREALRIDTIEYIGITGDLTVHKRITARRLSVQQYDEADAIDWCREHDPLCLKGLDKTKFKAKHADDYPGMEEVKKLSISLPSGLADLAIEAAAMAAVPSLESGASEPEDAAQPDMSADSPRFDKDTGAVVDAAGDELIPGATKLNVGGIIDQADPPDVPDPVIEGLMDCPRCAGSGYGEAFDRTYMCTNCAGSGKIPTGKPVERKDNVS